MQVVRSYVHDRDAATLLSDMGSGAADIAVVVSEVRARIPGLPTPPALEPEQARFRLFDSVTTFLKHAATRQPMVLVLDDLHWADKPSLLLLQFLARELRGARLLVIGTYRDVGLGRQHPLSQTLAELAREQLSERTLLRGLSEHDVARFIEITAGVKPPAGLVATVYQETEGNPFFVNEVVRLLVSDGRLTGEERFTSWGALIPQGVREVIGRRLEHLSEACNDLLTLAAVIGREFSAEALRLVSELSGDAFERALEEAVEARVVTEMRQAVESYTFSHALIRETLYAELATTRRVRLHRQVGEALEHLYGEHPEHHLTELAYHFLEAASGGDVEKAIDYAVRAGERASSVTAYEEAVRHYEGALQTLEQTEHGDNVLRLSILERLGEARWHSGEFEHARDAYRRAANVARTLGDHNALARAALGFAGQLAFETGTYDEFLVGLLEEALTGLGGAESALRADLLAALAEALTFSDTQERKHAVATEALALARRLGKPSVIANVGRRVHWACWAPGNLEERLALVREIVTAADAAGDRLHLGQGLLLEIFDTLEVGDRGVLEALMPRTVEIVDGLRQAYPAWALACGRATFALTEGRFAEAEEWAERALALGRRGGQNRNALQVYGAQIALLRREQGAERALEYVPAVKGFVAQFPRLIVWRCVLVETYLLVGRQAEAREELDRLAVADFAAIPHDMFWMVAMALLADACAVLGDERHARVLDGLLAPYAELSIMVPLAAYYGTVAHRLGRLAATMKHWDVAARYFECGIARDTRVHAWPFVAHGQHDYACMLLARDAPGDRAAALGLLGRALDTAERLKMQTLLEQALADKLRAQGTHIERQPDLDRGRRNRRRRGPARSRPSRRARRHGHHPLHRHRGLDPNDRTPRRPARANGDQRPQCPHPPPGRRARRLRSEVAG